MADNNSIYAHLLDIPEIAKILKSGKWNLATASGQQAFDNAIHQTNWYKKTTESQRQWDIYARTASPADKQNTEAKRRQQIQAIASQSGVTFDPKDLERLVGTSLRNGYSDADLQRSVGAKFTYDAKRPSAIVDEIKQKAAKYLVDLSDATIQDMARKVLTGVVTSEQIDADFKQKAKILFPTLAKAIDQGYDLYTYTSPWREKIAKVLETDPNLIDLRDPKYFTVIDQRDPKTGDSTAMSLADTERFIMQSADYTKTNGFKQKMAQSSLDLQKAFGFA